MARHAYKSIQLNQLRGFCETARLGSLVAAASFLELTQPTVWEQVRALEREFGTKLVEPHGRGCRLTEDGRQLARLVAPLVAGIDSLKQDFTRAQGQAETWLTIATTQRVLVEDLPRPIQAFERRYPQHRLRFLEVSGETITSAVESRRADLGLTVDRPSQSVWLEYMPLYELEPILITPRQHPLARRRRLRVEDLRGYPFVNATKGGFADPSLVATLDKLGVLQSQPQRVEAMYTAVIRRYVELGFGIGIVPGLPAGARSGRLHERSLARYFGRIAVNLIWRKGALPTESVTAFAGIVKKMLR
jgi:DNA-binding transcriptional LysR family regulator